MNHHFWDFQQSEEMLVLRQLWRTVPSDADDATSEPDERWS